MNTKYISSNVLEIIFSRVRSTSEIIPVNFLKISWGRRCENDFFATHFLSKTVHASEVMTISMGEMFGNFV